jgi:hypothetical protein
VRMHRHQSQPLGGGLAPRRTPSFCR